ncbi:PEP-CTERM system histidine kinase PrsK [Glaciecola sp. MH2013]|uniref:XrtA/PEP-CTERM system histidine kinase PrsK n=1 Tax=Glaciecola sp. MH2013 TaxID=2785524 RepID=UPI00189DAD5D|nr:XrtA/PEP-CTERM system histidine kinase PrsK [Glaciecola sp. MH2013]MBF7072028.1 PEP-CTERM system histidine kinase PrsK [Glaciecola sp. MH2013]
MLGNLGYGLAALGYFSLMLLLLTGRTTGFAKHLLLGASLVTCLWAASHLTVLGWQRDIGDFFVADAARQWVWMLFLAACLRADFSSFKQIVIRPTTLALLTLPTVALISAGSGAIPLLWQYSLHTIIALQMLIVLELVFRQAGEHKWAYKPLVLFLGALSLFDFVTYANATMINQIGENYVIARPYIYLCLLPFLILAIRRISHWGVTIFVSRDVVLHSTLLLVAGAYLFVMALVGYLVKFMGGSWSYPLQLALVAISLVLLISLFLSHNFRTRIKVFITKHFYANQFDYRVQWVQLTESLNGQDENLQDVYQTSLHAMLEAMEYESGVILKLQKSGLQQVAEITSGNNRHFEPDKVTALLSYFEIKEWIIDIQELKVKPHQYEELMHKDYFMEHFDYQLVIPMFKKDELWGMAFIDAHEEQRKLLNWELRDYINAVTAQVSNYLYQFEGAYALAENAQFAAFSRMSAFVLHDLKNVMAQIDLILANAQQHKSNPEFIDDTFETLEHTKARMDKMLKQLTDKKGVEAQKNSKTALHDLIQNILSERCQGMLPLPTFVAKSQVLLNIDSEKFSNVLYHLVSNAQQATSDSGKVSVELTQDVHAILTITDDGEGMSEHFIATRLFKAFDTTKGNAGMGIGAYDAKNYIEEIGGTIAVHSKVGEGTTFIITLPVTA